MKVEHFSIPLLCSFSSNSVCLVLELNSFLVLPSPSFSSFFFFFTSMSPLFTWTVETWKCRRRRKNARLWLLEEEEKARASGYWKKKKKFSCAPLVCCSCYCTVVQWTVQLACTVRKKQHFAAFSSPAYQTLKCVGPMYSKVCIFFYQTAANCVLIKTQPQPRSQTSSSSPPPFFPSSSSSLPCQKHHSGP